MPQSRDTMFLSLNPLSGRNERESASADKKTAETTETSIADKHVDGSWSNSLSPLKLAAAAFAGIGAYAALAPHLQDKGEGLMHLEHGIECIIDGLTGYRTALAKRKSGDSSGGHLPPSKKIITEEERDAVATQGTQRSASLPVEKTAVEEQRSTSLKGTQEEGEPVVGNPPEIINTPTKTEENTNRSLEVVNLADADEAVACTQSLPPHGHGTRFASKALRMAKKVTDEDEAVQSSAAFEDCRRSQPSLLTNKDPGRGLDTVKPVKQKRWHPNKEQLRRLEFYYKHSRSSFKDREGRMKILEELSKHGETEGQAKLHTWSMNRRTKEKRQAAQADMARVTGEAGVDVPQQQTVRTASLGPDPIALYLQESNPEACRVCGVDDDDGMYCEKCNGVYHCACVGLDAPPIDDFICPSCQQS